MIEIIKHGKNPYKTTCKSCGCIYSFSSSDVNLHDGQEDFGPGAICFSVDCPDCGIRFVFSKYSELEKND